MYERMSKCLYKVYDKGNKNNKEAFCHQTFNKYLYKGTRHREKCVLYKIIKLSTIFKYLLAIHSWRKTHFIHKPFGDDCQRYIFHLPPRKIKKDILYKCVIYVEEQVDCSSPSLRFLAGRRNADYVKFRSSPSLSNR